MCSWFLLDRPLSDSKEGHIGKNRFESQDIPLPRWMAHRPQKLLHVTAAQTSDKLWSPYIFFSIKNWTSFLMCGVISMDEAKRYHSFFMSFFCMPKQKYFLDSESLGQTQLLNDHRHVLHLQRNSLMNKVSLHAITQKGIIIRTLRNSN